MLARLRSYDTPRLFAKDNISCLTKNDRRWEYEISFKSIKVNRECQMAKISVSVAAPSEVVRKAIPCGEKIIDYRFQVGIQRLTKRSIIQERGFCHLILHEGWIIRGCLDFRNQSHLPCIIMMPFHGRAFCRGGLSGPFGDDRRWHSTRVPYLSPVRRA